MSSTGEPGYIAPDFSLFGDEHVRVYRETGGEVGHEWSGVHTLLLTTIGRKSGLSRELPVIYATDGDRYIVIASQGGAPKHPAWYLNLVDNPMVEVQVGSDRFPATAHAAEGPERERLWVVAAAVWPNFDVYATRTGRVIPVVVIERLIGDAVMGVAEEKSEQLLHLDPARLRELFDLQGNAYAKRGGAFEGDPYPAFARLRETGPVHEGIVGPLVGFDGDAFFQGLPYPDRPHFSVFDFETCEMVMRDTETFSSNTHLPGSDGANKQNSILFMDGTRHRRYRALVQPSFIPRRAQWWIENWIHSTVHALIDVIEPQGRADLNVDFFAAIPLLTICGSMGVTVADALDIRAAVISDGYGLERFIDIVSPIIPVRREEPTDDLISVLVKAEVEEDGERHVLTDDEILGFAFLLLAAGSGTTWKQMGITMLALLEHPEWMHRVSEDRGVLRNVVEESLRWNATDPMFSRFATTDVELRGVHIPVGSVVHACFGAANRDPARWPNPDVFDPGRKSRSHQGFGTGPHICLGMHVARAEIATAIGALFDRLPGLAPDPDADPGRVTGMYERGPTSVPVIWNTTAT